MNKIIFKLLILTLSCVFILSGCASYSNKIAVKEVQENQLYFKSSEKTSIKLHDNAETTLNNSDNSNSDTPINNEKLIFTANLTIETTDFDNAIEAAQKKLESFGGYIETSEIKGQSTYSEEGTYLVINRSANFVFRIPQKHTQTFLNQSGDFGHIINKTTSLENVTETFTDNEARLQTLKVEEERLLALIAKAEKIDDIIQLETKLSDVRYNIEKITATLRNLQSKVDYSFINIQIREVGSYSKVISNNSFFKKLGFAIKDSGVRFLQFMQNLIIRIVYMLPGFILATLLAFVLYKFVYKKIKLKRKFKHRNISKQETEEKEEIIN